MARASPVHKKPETQLILVGANVVIWWPAGFTCVIMALVVNLASSQIFFPTKVVTSRDITGTARPSRLDLLLVEIKGMRVDCL